MSYGYSTWNSDSNYYNTDYSKPVFIMIFSHEQAFWIDRNRHIENLREKSDAREMVMQKWKANNHVASYDFKRYPLRLMKHLDQTKTTEEHIVIVFDKSNYFLKEYSVWVDGNIISLDKKLKKLLVLCPIEASLIPAFKLVTLAIINRMLKATSYRNITLPEIDYFDSSQSELVRPKLCQLLSLYASSNEKYLNHFISEFISCTEVEDYSDLPIPVKTKEGAVQKYLKYFQSLTKKKRTKKVMNCLRNFVVLLNGGDATILLNLFSHVATKSSNEEFLKMVNNIRFENFEWKEQSFGHIKSSLVIMFEKLFVNKFKKKIELASILQLTKKVICNLENAPLSFEDFKFFFNSCLTKRVEGDQMDRLARFSFYSYCRDQADLIYSKIFDRKAKPLIEFSLKVINYYNQLYSGEAAAETKEKRYLVTFRKVVKSQFRTLYGIKKTLSNLSLAEFQQFNLNLGNFLDDELETLDRLKYSETAYTSDYHFSYRLKEIIKNEFLIKQLECELMADYPQEPKLVPALHKLVEDKYVLKNLLRAFGSEPKIFKKHHNRFVDFFVERVLGEVDKRLRNKKEKMSQDIEVREQLLDLAKHVRGEALLAQTKRLILLDFNSTFDFKGKFQFVEVLSKPKEKVSYYEKNKYKYVELDFSELFREIHDQIVIDEDDFDLDNEDFWEKMVEMAKEESGFEGMFVKCLGLVDNSFKYSLERLRAQQSLFELNQGCSWERAYLAGRIQAFEKLLETAVEGRPIFAEAHKEVPDLLKLFGVCCNPRPMKNVMMIKKLVEKKKYYWKSEKNLSPLFKKMKIVEFLVEFYETIESGARNYYEAGAAEFLSSELNLKGVDLSLDDEREGNDQVKRLFKVLRFLENDDFMSKVVDFSSVNKEMAQFDQQIKALPEKNLVVPSSLKPVVKNQRLIKKSQKTENRNGLVYLLGARNHFECLEHVLEIDQLIELKRILGKLNEGEEEKLRKEQIEHLDNAEVLILEEDEERQRQEAQNQAEEHEDDEDDDEEEDDWEQPPQEGQPAPAPQEQVAPQQTEESVEPRETESGDLVNFNNYKRITIQEVLTCLELNEVFSENLSKLNSTINRGVIRSFFQNEVKISYSRVSFMMRGAVAEKMETRVMKNIQKHVLFLRNSTQFAQSAKTVSEFFEFEDKDKLDEYYRDFFKFQEDTKNDDLVSVLNSIKDVPRVFFEVSSRPNALLRLFTIMNERRESKSPNPRPAPADQKALLEDEERRLRKRNGNADRPPGARRERLGRQVVQFQKAGSLLHRVQGQLQVGGDLLSQQLRQGATQRHRGGALHARLGHRELRGRAHGGV